MVSAAAQTRHNPARGGVNRWETWHNPARSGPRHVQVAASWMPAADGPRTWPKTRTGGPASQLTGPYHCQPLGLWGRNRSRRFQSTLPFHLPFPYCSLSSAPKWSKRSKHHMRWRCAVVCKRRGEPQRTRGEARVRWAEGVSQPAEMERQPFRQRSSGGGCCRNRNGCRRGS